MPMSVSSGSGWVTRPPLAGGCAKVVCQGVQWSVPEPCHRAVPRRKFSGWLTIGALNAPPANVRTTTFMSAAFCVVSPEQTPPT